MASEIWKAAGLQLGLGLLSIGRTWGVGQSPPPEPEEAQALLSTAVDLGIRFLDTAPAYAASEARLGQFLSDLAPSRREGLVVMTKVGEHWDHASGIGFVDHSHDAMVRSIDRSLDLLGSIDVLQIHKATRDVVTHPDVIAAMNYARRCGVSMFGASVSDVEAGMLALESGLYQALQFPLNRSNTSMLALLPALEASGCTAIINRPFAMGGLIADGSVDEAARTAFRFVEGHVPDGIVLSGTGRAGHLAQNAEAFRNRAA
jgi:aryl-alcohol dehydrogenase-like predicted oxidoreductase